MGRAHTGSNSTQEIGTRKRGSTISTGCSTMISLMSLSTVSSMDYRLDLVQKPICLTCFIGGTEPAFLEKKKINSFYPWWFPYLCMPTKWGQDEHRCLTCHRLTLKRVDLVLRDISICCKLFKRFEGGFDCAETTCVPRCCSVMRPWVYIHAAELSNIYIKCLIKIS